MSEKKVPANENKPSGEPAGKRIPVNENDPTFADDLLRGASHIAEFLFGDADMRRRVYYLAAFSNLPIFRIGSMLCARRSVLMKWVSDQEGRRA